MTTLTRAGQALGCMLALLLVLQVPTHAAAAKSAKTVTPASYVNATKVNLRAEPDGQVLAQLDKGAKVFVTARKTGWVKVSVPALSLTGWIAQQFVDSNAPAKPNPANTESPKPVASKPAKNEVTLAADEEDTELGGDLSTQIVLGDILDTGSRNVSADPPATVDEPEASWQTAAPAHKSLTLPVPTGDSTSAAEELRRLDVLSSLPTAKASSSANKADFIADGSSAVKSVTPATKPAVVPASKPADDKTAVQQAVKQPAHPAPAPKKLFTGDSTAVVTTPLMLEGSFYAVGGRDLAKIDATDVNLRHKPDTKSKSIAKLQPGDKIYLTSSKKDWYEVSVPARKMTGWVHHDFVHEFPKVEIKGNQVRLRDLPNTSSEIKDTLDNGEVFYEYERKNGWVKVASSASGVNGWVKAEYIVKSSKSPSRPYSVKGLDVNFRASPEVDADILAQLPQGTRVAVLGRNEKWSYIQVQGRLGWMYSQYLLPEGRRGFVVPSSPVGERLIARAQAMKGTPYVWGGESDAGVDCSGLIYKVLLDEGASGKCLPRRASEQMAQLGLEVDKEGLQPGDLVFFSTYKPGPSHVGIYLGDGDFIHASSAQRQVTISNLSEGYYKRTFCGARRLSEEELRSLK